MSTPDKSYIAGSQQSSSSVRSFDIDSKTGKSTVAKSSMNTSAKKQAQLIVHEARSTDASIGKWLAVRNRIFLDYPIQVLKVINGRVKGRFSNRTPKQGRSQSYSKSAHIRMNFVVCIDTKHEVHVLTDKGVAIAAAQLHHSRGAAITVLAHNAYYINNEFVFVTASTDGIVNIYKFAYDSFNRTGAVSLAYSTMLLPIGEGRGKSSGTEYVKNAHILYKKSAKEYEFYLSTSFGRNVLYKGTARGQMVVSLIDADIFAIGSINGDDNSYSASTPISQSFQSNVYFVYLRAGELVISKKLGDRVRQAVFDLSTKQALVSADSGDDVGTFANGTITAFHVDDRLVNLFLLADTGYVTLYKIMKGDSRVVFSDLKFMRTYRFPGDSSSSIARDASANKDDIKKGVKRSEILSVGNERYLLQSKACLWYVFDPRATQYSAKVDASYSGCFNGSTRAYETYNRNGFGGIRFDTAPDTDTFKPANVLNPEKAKYKDTLVFVYNNVRDQNAGFLGSLLGKRFYKGSVVTIYKGTGLHESILQNVIDAVRPFAFAVVVLVIVLVRYTFKGGKGGKSGRKKKISLEDTISLMQRRIDEDQSLSEEQKEEKLSLLLQGGGRLAGRG